MRQYDLIISGGRVVDGAGNPWFDGDVAVAGERIAAVGRLDAEAATKLMDASGLVVAPGFVDVHTHVEGGLLTVPTADNYLRQGVTTAIGGNCGGSPLPLSDRFEKLEEQGISCNLGLLVGHNAVRTAVMGLVDRKPTAEEMGEMKRVIAEAMDHGALGMSTGLKYVPGPYADTDEVVSLAEVVAQHGGIYASHLRDEGLGLIDAVREAIEIGRRARLPVELSHHKAVGKAMWGRVAETLAMVDAARAQGVDVTLDLHPYTATCTGLTMTFPAWSLEKTDDASLLTRLQDPEARSKIKAEIVFNIVNDRGSGDPANIVVITYRADASLPGKNLAQITESRGLPPTPENAAEVLMDLVLAEEGGGMAIYHCLSEQDVRTITAHPATMIASDGWVVPFGEGKTHPRLYGTFPRVLARFVRDEGLFSLEEAIRKMTSLPAQRMGLHDRGLLRPGMAADIVLFDPKTVQDRATWDNAHQYPEGVVTVIVNGAITVEDSEHLGTRSGVILRGEGDSHPAQAG